MNGVRIGFPHLLICPKCGFPIRAKYAWLARRRMRKHRETQLCRIKQGK